MKKLIILPLLLLTALTIKSNAQEQPAAEKYGKTEDGITALVFPS